MAKADQSQLRVGASLRASATPGSSMSATSAGSRASLRGTVGALISMGHCRPPGWPRQLAQPRATIPGPLPDRRRRRSRRRRTLVSTWRCILRQRARRKVLSWRGLTRPSCAPTGGSNCPGSPWSRPASPPRRGCYATRLSPRRTASMADHPRCAERGRYPQRPHRRCRHRSGRTVLPRNSGDGDRAVAGRRVRRAYQR